MERICRSCMKVNVNMKNVFENENDLQIINMFFDCTSIKIQKNDGLPPFLCSDCETKLETSFNFKEQSQKSDTLLKALVKHVTEIVYEQSSEQQKMCKTKDSEIISITINEETASIKEETVDITFEPEENFSSSELYDTKEEIDDVKEEISSKNNEEIVPELTENNVKPVQVVHDTESEFLPVQGSNEYECPSCKKTFIKEGNYLRHIGTHKDLEPLYNKLASRKTHSSPSKSRGAADECFITEEERSDETASLIGSEKKVEKFKCPACKKIFVKQGSFIKHIWTHENLDLTYPVIDKLLKKKAKKPQQKRRHVCKECGKSFCRKDFLSFHKRSAHNMDKVMTKRHLCVYCGKSFDYASNFLIHVRRHTGDLPYKCTQCKKAFPRYHDLKCHERQHSGEKPYLCSFCGKSFGLQYKLTRHLRVHTGEKPYKCDVCMSSFAQSNDLVNHAKRTHSYACAGCPARFVMRISLEKHCDVSGHSLDSKYKTQKISVKKETTVKDLNSDNDSKK